MSTGSASHRNTASGNKRTARHLEPEEMLKTSRAASLSITADALDASIAPPVTNVDIACVQTNTSALEAASTTIEAFVRTLRYPQQRAVFRDNALRYLHTFAEFYRESKILLKTKDDPSHCPPSCKVTIPLQPTQRVKESVAFKALADESARIASEISLKMASQILKCKCLNNSDKKRESVEIFAKGLTNMAEILLAEINTSSTSKHDLVADLLSLHESDTIGHINMTLDRFVEIYREVNKLSAPLRLNPPKEAARPTHNQPPNTAHQTTDIARPSHPTTPSNPPPTLANPLPPPPPNPGEAPDLPNPFLTATTTTKGTTTATTPSPRTTAPTDFVSALSLLPPRQQQNTQPNTTNHAHPTLRQPTPTQQTPPTTAATTFAADQNIVAQFEEAFNYDLTPSSPTTNHTPTEQATPHNPPPLYTTLNPYSRGESVIYYSREYTTQELETIQLAEQSHHEQAAASRTATLNSLRTSGRTMTSTLSVPRPQPTNDSNTTPATTPVAIIHTTAQGDTDSSTITGTGDANTPSSRSTVSFHHTVTYGTHHGALQTLRTAILKCFAAAQADYIRAFNAKAIEANLSKIAARQRIEECAEATAITIHSEDTPTPRTVGATIDARIRRSQSEFEKRLESLEQRLANEKNKSASFERRLLQQNVQPQQPLQSPNPTSRPPVKDPGATTVGAAPKKYTQQQYSAQPTNPKPRWTPPPTATTHPRPISRGGRNNGTQQNASGRGHSRYNARGRGKHRYTSTHSNAPRRPPT
jgi:hypothetical protein